MKQLVFFIAIICGLSIIISSCSKDEDEETQTAAEKAEAAETAETAAIAAIGLNGTWKGACDSTSDDNSTYGAQSFVSSGTSFSADWSQFSDSECSTKITGNIDAFKLDLGDAYTLADGNTAHKGVVTLVSTLLTYYTSTLANTATSDSFCGKEWVINTAQDIAGLTCGASTQDSAGVKTYILYYINGTSLQFGTSTADNVTSVSSTVYTKQ
jgi:hypothetical protein